MPTRVSARRMSDWKITTRITNNEPRKLLSSQLSVNRPSSCEPTKAPATTSRPTTICIVRVPRMSSAIAVDHVGDDQDVEHILPSHPWDQAEVLFHRGLGLDAPV